MDEIDKIDIIWVHAKFCRRGYGSMLVAGRPGSVKHVSIALREYVPFWDAMGFTYISNDLKPRV